MRWHWWTKTKLQKAVLKEVAVNSSKRSALAYNELDFNVIRTTNISELTQKHQRYYISRPVLFYISTLLTFLKVVWMKLIWSHIILTNFDFEIPKRDLVKTSWIWELQGFIVYKACIHNFIWNPHKLVWKRALRNSFEISLSSFCPCKLTRKWNNLSWNLCSEMWLQLQSR